MQSKKYLFIYTFVMVLVFSVALVMVSTQLKPDLQKNYLTKKKQDILKSVNIESTSQNAEELYEKYITQSLVVDTKGNEKSGIDAFKDIDIYNELKKPSRQRSLPVFICTKNPAAPEYILALRGKGLWGPIWGYVALKDDFNTISGTMFDQKGETPGLGAEINTETFQRQFVNKKIFDEQGNFTSVQIIKGKSEQSVESHGVDAISGGTITSEGVESMLFDCLKDYELFLKKNQKK